MVDGRNRLAACKIAGVKPVFVEHEGDLDENTIKSLVISLNNNRRHLSKGQKAMAVAIAWPEKSLAGRGNSSKNEELRSVHSGLLSMARKVLRVTPEAVQKVMSGGLPLSEAYGNADREERHSSKNEQLESVHRGVHSQLKNSTGDFDKGLLSMART